MKVSLIKTDIRNNVKVLFAPDSFRGIAFRRPLRDESLFLADRFPTLPFNSDSPVWMFFHLYFGLHSQPGSTNLVRFDNNLYDGIRMIPK